MAILIDENSRVVVQGITGRQGAYHAQLMMDYGTKVVGGVRPGKGGDWFSGVPVFDTMQTAVEVTGADVSIVTVPAMHAADAIFEAVDSGIRLIVCLTEHIPIRDMLRVYHYVRAKDAQLIGPNCPGIMVPERIKVGIIPAMCAIQGNVGIVSRSGTLTYEVAYALKMQNLGVSTMVGIGGDPIVGTHFVEILDLFEADPETDQVVLIGEIGGYLEFDAADYIRSQMTKPVIAFIAGSSAPPGQRMGHAGAVVRDERTSAAEKRQALMAAGARIAYDPEQVPVLLAGE